MVLEEIKDVQKRLYVILSQEQLDAYPGKPYNLMDRLALANLYWSSSNLLSYGEKASLVMTAKASYCVAENVPA